jgi:carbonic anhydrase
MVSISTTFMVSPGAIELVRSIEQNRLNHWYISRAIAELQKGTGLKRCDPLDHLESDVSECRRDAEEAEVEHQEKRKEKEVQNSIASLIEEHREQKALKQRKKATLQGWWHATQAVVQG